MLTVRVFFLFSLLGMMIPVNSAARSLYWQDMRVSATLDGDGRLHVLERQTMVFSGAWNGGERRINLRPGQRLVVHNIYRINPGTDTRISLMRGDLSKVDHWVRYNGNTVRWRARLPSDPPFTHRVIIYLLEYTLSGILLPVDGDGYQFRHDFAFPDRDGVIEHFSLDLILNSPWKVRGSLPTHVERTSLPPGTSVILSAILQHPDGVPAAAGTRNALAQRVLTHSLSPVPVMKTSVVLQVVLIVSLWILVIVQGMNFLAHERNRGRFHPLIPVDQVNESWLEQYVFPFAPEVVGATWDKKTDSSEVAAVLARMVQEKKMSSRVEQEVIPWLRWKIPGAYTLHLHLLVPRSTLRGYELDLVNGLFIDGDTTSTKKVKKYYRRQRKVFDPVGKIREPLRNKVEMLTKDRKNSLETIWIPTFFLAAAAFFLLFADFFLHPQEHVQELLTVGVLSVIWMIGGNFAVAGYRATAERVGTKAYLLLFFVALVAIGYMTMLLMLDCSALLTTGGAVFCAALINNILNLARTRDSVAGVRLHRYLASGHRYFKQELKQRSPKIDDKWFPYLVAFGLGPQVDSWFRRYGNNSIYGGSAVSGGGNSGFTGGGGQFGGGGVSGAWGAAAGSMGASSGGSFGGGGGSGGGGGGGF